jgi:HD-GYP domain-containing protein (c-di-GMP phosphodiesterase class II)
MTSDRPYRQALPVNEALEYIMSVADMHYSVEITKAFIKKINPYPVGSLVKLKDGQTAVIRKVPADMPLRPLISIIKKKSDGFEYQDVNLMENQTISIEGIQY